MTRAARGARSGARAHAGARLRREGVRDGVTVGCAGILVADSLCGPIAALPRSGQLLTVDDIPAKAGGCAANVAIDLARQNIDASVVGCVGQRRRRERFRSPRCASTASIAAGSSASEAAPTSKTVILLVKGEDRRYIHSFGANAALTVAHIRRDWVERLKVFYLGGLFVMPGLATDELVDLLNFCRRSGVVTVITVAAPQPFDRHARSGEDSAGGRLFSAQRRRGAAVHRQGRSGRAGGGACRRPARRRRSSPAARAARSPRGA